MLVQTPDFYADTPPAPAGLTWWHYRDGVPPLPQPATYFGMSNWSNWGWQYDSDYTVPFYQFSNLDKVLLSAVTVPRAVQPIACHWYSICMQYTNPCMLVPTQVGCFA